MLDFSHVKRESFYCSWSYNYNVVETFNFWVLWVTVLLSLKRYLVYNSRRYFFSSSKKKAMSKLYFNYKVLERKTLVVVNCPTQKQVVMCWNSACAVWCIIISIFFYSFRLTGKVAWVIWNIHAYLHLDS